MNPTFEVWQVLRNNAPRGLALGVAAGLALSACAQEEEPQQQGPGIQQISERVDLSPKAQQAFDKLQTTHDGDLAGFGSALQANAEIMFGHAEELEDLYVEVNGTKIHCGLAAAAAAGEELFKAIDTNTYDPNDYGCNDTNIGTYNIEYFVPYLDKIEATANAAPSDIPPEVVTSIIYQTGQELFAIENNPGNDLSRSSMLSNIYIDSYWTKHGRLPTEEEKGQLVDNAIVEVYGVNAEMLAANAGEVTTSPQPDPSSSETGSEAPLAPTEFRIDPAATFPFTSAEEIYALPEAAEGGYLYTASDDMNSGSYDCEALVQGPCTEVQKRALYAAEFYVIDINSSPNADQFKASSVTATLAVYNLLVQINDPAIQAKGGIATYTQDLLESDIKAIAPFEYADDGLLKEEVSATLQAIGVTLPQN